MKAYKATYNMKCKTLKYEVGKTYTFHGELIMCSQGFHFCEDPKNTRKYYHHNEDFELLEIEVLGEVLIEGDKSVTDKFKVVRVIPKSEYGELLGIYFDSNNNIIKEVYPDGGTWLYEYDSNNNKIKQVNPDGETYLQEYDSNNNMIKEIYPDGDTYLYEYDSNNNMIKEVSPRGYICLWEYDSENNMIKKIDHGETWSIEIE